MDDFAREFAAAWQRMTSRFVKLECWQEYEEIEASASQSAYERGDMEQAVRLLRTEAASDLPLYRDVRRRGLDYVRLRLVQEPLTAYMRYELMSYDIRAGMGENIEVARWPPARLLPDENHFDFLLFDGHTALVHDYGVGRVGRQAGGWLSHDPLVIGRLTEIGRIVRDTAEPLSRYLAGRV